MGSRRHARSSPCVTTYLVLPVIGFRVVLLLIESPTTGDHTRLFQIHLVLLGFLILWAPVWTALTGIAP